MISNSTICGPLCQHPGCWKAKCTPASQDNRDESIEAFHGSSDFELPTLSVSVLEPDQLQRHRSLPPIKTSTGASSRLHTIKSHSAYSQSQQRAPPVPRVSHIIVQAGFQCHAQKRWIWLPSLENEQPPPLPAARNKVPCIKDLTDELIQSRPASSKVPYTRMQNRLTNSNQRGSSYLELIRKLGHLNLLDLPHYLQVKLLENNHFRKILSTHPIDNIPLNALSESVLLDLMRCQLSPQLPANPSLEGVGIFFDPPDDLTPKQEPKSVSMPKRRVDVPEPVTYVPSSRKIEPSDLPGPMIQSVGKPSFREYVMKKRSSRASSLASNFTQTASSNKTSLLGGDEEECGVSHVTSVTTTIKESSDEPKTSSEKEEDDEGGLEEAAPQSLDIVLPADEAGIRIPSAVEESEELELMGMSGSVPPTRDSWRHTSFSTVTPFSELEKNAEEHGQNAAADTGNPTSGGEEHVAKEALDSGVVPLSGDVVIDTMAPPIPDDMDVSPVPPPSPNTEVSTRRGEDSPLPPLGQTPGPTVDVPPPADAVRESSAKEEEVAEEVTSSSVTEEAADTSPGDTVDTTGPESKAVDSATVDAATADAATVDGATVDGATADGATADGATVDGSAVDAGDTDDHNVEVVAGNTDRVFREKSILTPFMEEEEEEEDESEYDTISSRTETPMNIKSRENTEQL